jgi:hypothetical protein
MGVLALKKNQTRHLHIVRDPLDEPARNRVRLVTLFNSVDLQKDYHGYCMVYDGRKIRKLVRWSRETLDPTKEEIRRFLIDIINAAKKDQEIRDFIKKNPFPTLQ